MCILCLSVTRVTRVTLFYTRVTLPSVLSVCLSSSTEMCLVVYIFEAMACFCQEPPDKKPDAAQLAAPSACLFVVCVIPMQCVCVCVCVCVCACVCCVCVWFYVCAVGWSRPTQVAWHSLEHELDELAGPLMSAASHWDSGEGTGSHLYHANPTDQGCTSLSTDRKTSGPALRLLRSFFHRFSCIVVVLRFPTCVCVCVCVVLGVVCCLT